MEVSGGVLMTGEAWPAIRMFLGDPGAWLPLPAAPVDEEHWLITVRGGPAMHSVLAEVDEFEDRDFVRTRSMRWSPTAGASDGLGRLLPRFDGRLDICPLDDRLVLLSLTGVYDPPGGRFGATADRAWLHRVAESTVHAFLEQVGARLRAASPDLALVGDG